MPTNDEIDQVINLAKRYASEGRYEAAEAVLDRAIESFPPADIAKAKRQLKHDGQTVGDDWSEVGDDTSDDGDDDQTDDGDGGDDEEEDTPRTRAAKAALVQIEDEVDRIEKALRHSDGVFYPHSETSDLLHHQNLTPPSTTMHSAQSGTYSTGSWPATKEPTPFDEKVFEIMHRDGVSKMEAMSRARREDPQSFHSYQGIAKLGRPKYAPTYPEADDQQLQRSGRDKSKSHRTGRVKHHDQSVKEKLRTVGRGRVRARCQRNRRAATRAAGSWIPCAR